MFRSLMFLILASYFAKLCSSEIDLRPTDDVDVRKAFDADDRSVLLFIRPNNNLRTKTIAIQSWEESGAPSIVKKEKDENEDELFMTDLNLDNQQKEVLRKRWTSSCEKKASRVCIEACKASLKAACESYHCKRSMKNSFKRECKRNCKSKFIISSKYSDTE